MLSADPPSGKCRWCDERGWIILYSELEKSGLKNASSLTSRHLAVAAGTKV